MSSESIGFSGATVGDGDTAIQDETPAARADADEQVVLPLEALGTPVGAPVEPEASVTGAGIIAPELRLPKNVLWMMPSGGVGAIGGSTGDRLWFSLLRGRIRWLDRFPWLGKYRDVVSARVHAHQTAIVLAGRFLPGLRTAIPIACAYAGMRALTFTLMIQRGRGGVAIVAGFEPADLPRLIRFATI